MTIKGINLSLYSNCCSFLSWHTMAPRARGVRLHLGGRVRLEPPCFQAGQHTAVSVNSSGPARRFGSSYPQSWRPDCPEAALQRAGRVHERLDSTQRGNSQVRKWEELECSWRAVMSHDSCTQIYCFCCCYNLLKVFLYSVVVSICKSLRNLWESITERQEEIYPACVSSMICICSSGSARTLPKTLPCSPEKSTMWQERSTQSALQPRIQELW